MGEFAPKVSHAEPFGVRVWHLHQRLARCDRIGAEDASTPTMPSSPTVAASISIGVIAVALIAIGVESHSLNVHVVQITPLMLALIVLRLAPDWGVSVAAPLCAAWLLVMGGIWLLLLGIAQVFAGTLFDYRNRSDGHHRWGIPRRTCGDVPRGIDSAGVRLTTVVVFGAVQSAALRLSYQPIVTGR